MTCRCVAPVDITVYRNPASEEGRQAMLFFERKGVRWDDVDVTVDAAARQQIQSLSGQAERPVIVVDGQVFVGYDPATLEPLVPSRF
jgi:arsenate reductase-like glutaredoxin family protein